MTEPGKFLSRWSQRKHEAREKERAPDPVDKGQEAKAPEDERAAKTPAASQPEAPAVDLSTLPPIESIAAATDIRGFLAPGVPPELTRAALRRAWTVDPKIKNFIEMAENQWDFTSPDTPGFGTLSGVDVRRLVAEVLGENRDPTPREPDSQKSPGQPPAKAIAEQDFSRIDRPAAESAQPETAPAERATVAAAQYEPPTPEIKEKPVAKRRHGGALPE